MLPRETSRRLKTPGLRLGGAAALAGAALLSLAVLDRSVCPTVNLFGLPCPGCGMTRAVLLLMIGDWPGAWRLHPLSPVLAGLVLHYALKWSLRRRLQGPTKNIDSEWQFPAVCFSVALLALWCFRFFGFFGGPATAAPLFGKPLLEALLLG